MSTKVNDIFYPITYPINTFFAKKTPCEIIATTVSSVVSIVLLKKILLKTEWKRLLIHSILMFPPIAKKIDSELNQFKIELEEKLFSEEENQSLDVTEENWNKGQATGAVYHNRLFIRELILKAIQKNLPANPLHPELFPSVRKDEAAIVEMTKNLFHGDEQTCGQVTSGGTESILLACLAARKRGEDLYGITKPEIIFPSSAHASFIKAAEYFKLKPIVIPVDSKTFEADTKKMAAAITLNTVLIVGSAPCYPYGIIDPIEKLSQIVESYNGRIGLHVDCCLGGFLLPFITHKRNLEPFDFTCSGVTSLSADTHKYGYAPKGNSVILYRNQDWCKYQIFTHSEWCGGAIGTPTLLGSRSGCLSAAARAVMDYMLLEERYTKASLAIVKLTEKLIQEIKKIESLEILGSPQASVVSFRFVNSQLDVYELKDMLKDKGWCVADLQHPPALHFCLTLVHVDQNDFINKFINDLKICIEEMRKNPSSKKSGLAALYGTKQQIPASFSSYVFERFVQAYFLIIAQSKPRVWKKINKAD